MDIYLVSNLIQGAVMKPSEFFGILNHFANSKDSTQLLSMSNDIEVFSSKTFGTGKLTIGKDAPTAFRDAINSYAKEKKTVKLDVMSLSETDSGGIIGVNVVNGRSKYVGAFSIILKNKQIIAFVE